MLNEDWTQEQNVGYSTADEAQSSASRSLTQLAQPAKQPPVAIFTLCEQNSIWAVKKVWQSHTMGGAGEEAIALHWHQLPRKTQTHKLGPTRPWNL